MPIASPHKEQQLPPQMVCYQHIIAPKPSGPVYHNGTISSDYVTATPEGFSIGNNNWSIERGQQTAIITSSENHSSRSPVFSTNSPPILNLSPNLSPHEQQRGSPFYDFRETTRRRGFLDVHGNVSQPMRHSPIFHNIITDDADRKSESPSRKRRKTSGSIIDLTDSPSPPPSRHLETLSESTRVRRNSIGQRRTATGERCNTPRARRSPPTRRRLRTPRHSDNSPERRAFQPPPLTSRRTGPNQPQQQQQQPQHPAVDVDRARVTNQVTMTPYAIPVCSGPHHIPLCTAAHLPMCTTQSTWSIPACGMPMPTCSIQHLPACSLQLPVSMAHTIPPLLHHGQPPHHHIAAHQHHIPPPTHFPHNHHPNPHQRHEEELQNMLADRRPQFPIASAIPHGATFNPSPPLLLQEPTVHTIPHELYGPYSRYYARRTSSRNNRLRYPPPPPPYPGFLLHFLAMLGNPPLPPSPLSDDATEVENYEALLNLAERLGDAKPKGLTKAEIDLLPAYRFNSETRRTEMDMTNCVVCMCDFENRQLLRVLPCSHEFHAKCVDKWLRSNRTCPICRADASQVCSQSE